MTCRHLAALTRLCWPEMTHSASRGTRFSAGQTGFWREANASGGLQVFSGASDSSAPPFTRPGADDANRTHSRVTGLRLAYAKHCSKTSPNHPPWRFPLESQGLETPDLEEMITLALQPWVVCTGLLARGKNRCL